MGIVGDFDYPVFTTQGDDARAEVFNVAVVITNECKAGVIDDPKAAAAASKKPEEEEAEIT